VSFQSRFHISAGKEGAGDRLWPALTLSAALHLLLLWPAALPRPAAMAGMPLTATLREPVPAVPAIAAPSAAVSAPARHPVMSARPKPLLLVADSERPAAVPPALTFAAGASASADPAAVPARATAGPFTATAEEGVDADGVRAYRMVLAGEARAHRRYPPLARERGWTGTAEVSVGVSREGQARQILLARSSGHKILDREAVNMMSRAAASAALPNSLRGREFAVSLPVVFDLDDRL
jgi:protein TonB